MKLELYNIHIKFVGTRILMIPEPNWAVKLVNDHSEVLISYKLNEAFIIFMIYHLIH